jgi:hypothetical protein
MKSDFLLVKCPAILQCRRGHTISEKAQFRQRFLQPVADAQCEQIDLALPFNHALN